MRFYIFFRKKADVSVDFFFIVCAGLREVKEQKLIKKRPHKLPQREEKSKRPNQ